MKKKSGKKLAALMLCAALVFALLPGMLSAAKADGQSYSLWVGDVEVTSDNTSGNCDGGGTWSYEGNSSSGTLTLDNATITKTHTMKTPHGSAIYDN